MALYLFADRSWVVENFNDQPVTIGLDGRRYRPKPRAWRQRWSPRPSVARHHDAARSVMRMLVKVQAMFTCG